jgi:chitodextrinase
VPAAPSDLAAFALSSSAIQLTWKEPSSESVVEKFKIERDGVEVAETAALTYADSGLSQSTQYCYRVTAVDVHGNESTASNTACAITNPSSDTLPPSAPANLTATAVSTTVIELSWEPANDDTGVVGFTVTREGVRVANVSALTATDVGLSAATEYCYTVTAYDDAGNQSTPSNEACASTNSVGAWDILLKCQGQDYNLQTNLDLNERVANMIQVSDTGTDYDGTPLAYVITGTYDDVSTELDAQITFTFEGSPCVRVDEFSAFLSGGDTGDIEMNQIQQCGCTAAIRFVRSGSVGATALTRHSRRRPTRFFGHGAP